MSKDWGDNELDNYKFFCAQNDDDESLPWVSDGSIKIDYESLATEQDSHVFLDFQRPLIEEGSANALDLEAGSKYLAYISYYLHKNKKESTT